MLPRLSIRARLIAVISFLLVAMAGSGLLAITRMQTINDHTVDITTHWLPSVRVLGELRADINSYRVFLRQFVIEIDPQKKAASEKSIESAEHDIDERFKAYEAFVASPE